MSRDGQQINYLFLILKPLNSRSIIYAIRGGDDSIKKNKGFRNIYSKA